MPSGWRPRLPKPSLADPGEGPSAASPRRRRLLWTLLILLVLFLIGAFASATRPRHRDLVLLDELAAARSTESRIAALNRSFRSSFRSPPLPSDLAIPRTFRLLPTEADGLGSGWTFLLLQGLGEATADSALQTQSHLMSRHGFGGVTWLIPQAPRRTMPVAPNPKMADAEPPAWFGISTFEDLHRAEDLEGYRQSARAIHRLLREENVDPSRLIIGGFSMGSVMSLIVSLTMDPAPAGVYVLSGFLPLPRHLSALAPASRSLPLTDLIWLHGQADRYLRPSKGETGFRTLNRTVAYRSASFRSFAGLGHAQSDDERAVLADWAKAVVEGRVAE